MRKGIKILGKVLSVTALLLIIIPLLLSLLLDIPVVQNFVIHKAARMISAKLETTVSIDRVDIGMFAKVKVKGFYVEDYQRDTLLYVGRLDAYITSLGIFGGGVELNRAAINDAKFYLRQAPDGEMNIKQIVDRLSNPDKPKKGNFSLSLKKATIENMDFCLERLERRNPPYGIDFGHMHLLDMTAHIDDFTIDGQALYTTIAALTARERSGFVLDHLAGRFYMTQGCIGFEDAAIVTAHSNISIPYISIVGNSWAEYKDFVNQVRIDGLLRNSTVSTDDIAYFAPKMRDWHIDLSQIDVEVSGVVADLTGKIKSLRIGKETFLTADASVTGLPDVAKTHFALTIPRLHSTAEEIDVLTRSIAHKNLSDKVMKMLDNSGNIDLSARFSGLLTSFDMRLGATTGVGDVSCNLKMTPFKEGLSNIRGDIETRNLRLGDLLGDRKMWGDATLVAYIDGVVGRGYADAQVVGDVERLEFNGYNYDALKLDGRLRNRQFDGVISARDSNLDFDFKGLVDLNDSVPRYDFTLDLRRADLAKLHINRRDSVSQLRAHVVARASGRSLDDMNGRVEVTDAFYRYNDKELTASKMTITGENSASSKFIDLHSTFADATFRSKTSYKQVFEYLQESAWRYLPLLRGENSAAVRATRKTAVANDYSLLSVDIRNFNPLADAVSPGLQIADGSSLRLLFNPASDQLSLKATSEYIERDRMLATRLNVNASNRGDSLTVYASAEDLYAGVVHLPHLSMTGGAKKGQVQISAGFNDTTRHASGLLGIRAGVLNEHGPNGRVVDLRILPSHLTRGDKTWQIMAHKILLDTAEIVIDKFFVSNKEQELLVNGIASRSRDDSVTLRLSNFDMAPFTQVVERMGYLIEGRMNGLATMKSVLRRGEVSADIAFDSVEVNQIQAPPMRLTSRWDFARNRAGVTVTDRQRRDTLIRGFYAPEQVRYYARLQADSLNMGLLDPILSGVISSTHGVAAADLVLEGQRREANLSGQIRVRDLSTTVDFTQVAYTMPEATLHVANNRFTATDVPVFDPEGNRGRFDIDLNLQHLSNIAYDVRISPQQMLVLNTTAQDNELFYGKIYASGRARIKGDKGMVNMDISASTDDNSSFFLPLSDKSNISNADFVTFEEPKSEAKIDDLMRRKQLFERKKRQQSDAANQMVIALALDVRPNTSVEMSVAGNVVKARGSGQMNLQIKPRSNIFEIYGDYTISEGSYLFSLQNIINKSFTIESGSTILLTGAPMDALLNINAVYKLKASLQPLLQGATGNIVADRSVPVECVIHLGDRLSAPAISFNVHVPGLDPEMQTIVSNVLSTPETIDTQFLSLLVLNSFMADNNATNTNIGSSVSAATGLEFLSSLLSNWLSIDDYNVVIRYRPRSELTSEEVDFGLSKSLINNRLFVELEGNYLIDNKQTVNNMSNFMGEAYITYLIDRGGTLKLKAFTQTIDRFDENQGLQETGIGVYYKEDFNNFRDLRQRIKDHFTNKKRKAQRALQREARRAERERERNDSTAVK